MTMNADSTMNRHKRRAAAARARQARLYPDYVRHLPRVPLDAPLDQSQVYFLVRGHEKGCAWFAGERCSCVPRLRLHVNPVRQ